MAQFFTNPLECFEKAVDVKHKYNYDNYEIDFLYEIARCVRWIRDHNYEKVCLQFCDTLLEHSTQVAKELEAQMGRKVYILADTAYESCCVDYTAAQHIDADAIIHYGPQCFAKQTETIPTLYIYEKPRLDLDKLFNEIIYKFNNNEALHVILDTPYLHYKDRVDLIKNLRADVMISGINDEINIKDATALYIGENDRKLTNFYLIYKPSKLYYFENLSNSDIREYDFNTYILKRRRFLVEKIKDSKTVGVVIATLAVKDVLRVLNRIKQLCKLYAKKYYLISVGKPNEAKLLNFPEMDVYVVVSCAMNEFLDKKDFYKPLVTPYDMEIALNPNASIDNFNFELDLIKSDEITVDLQSSDVSLITGNIRTIPHNDEQRPVINNMSEIALKSSAALVLPQSGAGFLAQRAWKGLEQNLGKDEAAVLSEGRKGIAQGYENEVD